MIVGTRPMICEFGWFTPCSLKIAVIVISFVCELELTLYCDEKKRLTLMVWFFDSQCKSIGKSYRSRSRTEEFSTTYDKGCMVVVKPSTPNTQRSFSCRGMRKGYFQVTSRSLMDSVLWTALTCLSVLPFFLKVFPGKFASLSRHILDGWVQRYEVNTITSA